MADLKPVYIDQSSGQFKEPRSGDTLINEPDLTVDTISDLIAIDKDKYKRTETVQTLGYYSKIDGGGGLFYYDSAESQTNHNGGTVIDPQHTQTIGSSGWYSSENSGTGCWVRVEKHITLTDFGYENASSQSDAENAFNNISTPYEKTIATEQYVDDEISLVPTPPSGYRLKNAMWSWWAKPCILRHRTETHDKTFMAVSGLDGELAVAMYDHRTSEVSIQRLSTDFTQDDHNTGAVVVDDDNLVVFYPGRTSINDDTKLYYYEFNGLDITKSGSLQSFDDTNRVDYPNAYNYNDSLLVFYRRSAGSWGVRTFSWPQLVESGSVTNFLQTEYTQVYVASRRNRTTRSRIDIAMGHHPENDNHGDLYVGYFDGSTDPQWDIKDFSGSVLGNASDGSGLSLGESDFTKVYTANGGENTRLFDVTEGAVAFATYPDGDNESGDYKISRYNGTTWDVFTVVGTGKPFYNPSAYYGGIAFSDKDKDTIYVSREIGDEEFTWVVDEYKYNGTSFEFVNRLDGPTSEVTGRPMTTLLSEDSDDGNELPSWFKGQYDFTDYTKWIMNIESSPVQAQAESAGEITSNEVVRTGIDLTGQSEIIIPIDINDRYSFFELLLSGIALETVNSDDLQMQVLDSNEDPIGVGSGGAGDYAYRLEKKQTNQDASIISREEAVDHAVVGRMQSEVGFLTAQVQVNGIENRIAIKVNQSVVSSGATGVDTECIVTLENVNISNVSTRYLRFYTAGNENFNTHRWETRKRLFVKP